ncbi:MAG: hydroxymethylglutaryl-CoA reductase, degradative [Candidatus Thermoplasmatota archaeon]|nr:hydroxymethylglutaryl-CoA reductase, degradative [Candidatus Thermoplasmatota archaeon]
MDSRISGFYSLSIEERHQTIANALSLSPEHFRPWINPESLDQDTANRMIENVVGQLSLPVGIGMNFLIDGESKFIPFCVEESSIVAAASNIAKRAYNCGGFTTNVDPPLMIGQLQILDIEDINSAIQSIEEKKEELMEKCNDIESTMIRLGGGCKDIECKIIESESQRMLVVHLIVDTRDAMGANAVNTMAERAAPWLETITGGRVLLRILSNLATKRLARASVKLSPEAISSNGNASEGTEIINDIILAYHFADADPWRAATHNKGIMNAISPIGLACGQDWRAIEAGAHAYAAITGRYRSMTKWWVDEEGWINGSIEVPIAVGIVGGASKIHPVARLNLELTKSNSAQELAGLMVCAGLAQNLGAMRALATKGIQEGHMRLHLRNMVMSAGATPDEVDVVADAVRQEGGNITQSLVDAKLEQYRNQS